ncbi:hypothetical protein [Hymenobacter sp. B81]|uniref:hypothetical protein n=1 Tax=Hymenobacter sp. B81 TaxID=3344878 RepID=UPI0037DC9DF0
MQRRILHSSPKLIRLRPQAKFDSMWRLDMLLSVAEGHRLDAQRVEIEEVLAERQQRLRTWSQSGSRNGTADLAEHRTFLELAAPQAAADSAEISAAKHFASHHMVSRLAARSTGAGRLTAFLGVAAAAQSGSAGAAGAASFSFCSPPAF